MKTCSKCRSEKPFEAFSKDKGRRDGLCPQCKDCQLAHRAQHRERERLRSLKWSAENPDRKKATDAAWRKANPSRVQENKNRWAQENPEVVRVRKQLWAKENPAKLLATCRRRQAAKLQATPLWADAFVITGMYELAQVFRRTGLLMEVDHVVPLRGKTVCGFHSQDNLQLLVRAENARKLNNWLDL